MRLEEHSPELKFDGFSLDIDMLDDLTLVQFCDAEKGVEMVFGADCRMTDEEFAYEIEKTKLFLEMLKNLRGRQQQVAVENLRDEDLFLQDDIARRLSAVAFGVAQLLEGRVTTLKKSVAALSSQRSEVLNVLEAVAVLCAQQSVFYLAEFAKAHDERFAILVELFIKIDEALQQVIAAVEKNVQYYERMAKKV